MDSLNRMATELVDEAIDFADELTIDVHALSGDAAVLDFGVEVPGAVEAGMLLAEIQTAGLATVQTTMDSVGSAPLTHVELSTDHPALALLCSQKGGWEVATDDFEGLGSGPARALVGEEDVFQRIGYREDADFAVLAIESDELPDEAVAGQIAERTGVPETAVFMPTFATASVTGSVVAAARAAELAVYRLAELGFDPAEVLSANARAPMAPVAADEASAMARTTDALAYGGEVHLTVDEDFDRFDEVASVAGAEYGRPLEGVFDDADWDFGELPVDLFGPAQVTIDVVGGDTHVVGETHEDVLVESFGL
ncbi:methenyltetrahydromethanopterin cyclohydrolase [Haloarcula nitratireducens]|uniref:Methenyltetrahydromethanopterin cyclohydrolase n=1 Tax=Haloarcula nitratireducens TaxID=2487749 RepID=A0AAW4PBN3_9EURY|nr:methenyltetrahydromethanopterin cyclohydrolase [Halomicroarcula nitratireducens]MBX0294890.1 methenyltetrahydromethanopterin cyclohydrolase [Halomicroarcula nitratireducens]